MGIPHLQLLVRGNVESPLPSAGAGPAAREQNPQICPPDSQSAAPMGLSIFSMHCAQHRQHLGCSNGATLALLARATGICWSSHSQQLTAIPIPSHDSIPILRSWIPGVWNVQMADVSVSRGDARVGGVWMCSSECSWA